MSDEMQREQDRVLVELAASKLLKTSSGATQEQGRDRYVQSKTRGSGTPVVVDDVDRPSCVIEAFAPRYEAVLEYLALFGSPAVGWSVGVWLGYVASGWSKIAEAERKHAVRVAAELLRRRRRDLGLGRHDWVPLAEAVSEAS
ncbi:hypothetical protein [Streptomyces sp. RTd22]|uniref:hypothetical protein n=1 Tax=Streptomyces sp. RTd22 TaxID=1841249 RepID=UPI00131D5D9F|nr:hypothetical protein [Streptomyces sp. RTd22]